MNIGRKNSLKLILILSILIITIYFPYIINGGFGPSDDISFINSITLKSEYDLSLFNSLSLNSGRFRPVGDFLTNIIFLIFKDDSRAYIVLQLLIWFSSVSVISFILKYIFEKRVAYIFILFGCFPCFSTSSFYSPYMISYTLSILFWSLSLLSLIKYLIYHKIYNYYLCYLFFLASLLTLPLVLPLILITSFLPIIYIKYAIKTKDRDKILFFKFLFPVVFLSLIYLLSKLFITKLYQNDGIIYGMNGMDLKSIFQGFYFIIAIIIEIPILFISTLNFIFRWETIIIIIFISLYFNLLRKLPNNLKIKFYNRTSFNHRMFQLFFISLISCMSIFIISGYPAVTFGHYNKMMMPTHFLGCILISCLFNNMLIRERIVATVLFFVLWSSSMVVQVDKFIDSWEIRKTVLSDCTEKLNNTDLGNEPYLIASVPFFTDNNYNNEHVFWLSWDFSSGLKIFGSKKLSSAFPFCWQTLVNPNYFSNHNINHHIAQLPENANLWYYEFDFEKSVSILRSINNRIDLKKEFQRTLENKVNYHPIILRERIRLKLKDLVTSYVL